MATPEPPAVTPEPTPAAAVAGAVPVACTFTPAGLAGRRLRWQRLADRAMTGRTETADGLRICFRGGQATEQELRDLAAAESSCCRWAAWTLRPDAGQIVLEIRAAGEGVAVLHGMFTTPASFLTATDPPLR